MQNIFFLIICSLWLWGCDSNQQEEITHDPISLMSSEERRERVPNDAFAAVFRRDHEQVLSLLTDQKSLFNTYNARGETPLMIALQQKDDPVALAIIEQLTAEELYAKDLTGRGYISYAAAHGSLAAIDALSERYINSLKWGVSRYYNLDFADNKGRHALFYAVHSAAAQRLKDYWMKWTVTYSMSWTFLSGFYTQKDKEEKNFFHTAAMDNRFDTLKWGVSQICGDKLWHDAEILMGTTVYLGQALDWIEGGLQNLPLIPDDLINQQDSEKESPLHLAVQKGHLESAQVLMGCRLTKYTLTNKSGRNPLAELLANIDPNQEQISQRHKDIFSTLLQRQNRYRMWWNNLKDIVDQQDKQGRSAMHWAARLKDSYFYDTLVNIGDPYLKDHSQRTPRDVHQAR